MRDGMGVATFGYTASRSGRQQEREQERGGALAQYSFVGLVWAIRTASYLAASHD